MVYNRLFAWKQSFAVVDEAAAKLYVSTEFPQFFPNSESLSIEFAALVLSSPSYANHILRRSTGSTAVSRNRLKVQDFLLLKIPMPSRDVQDALVKEARRARRDSRLAAMAALERRAQAWATFEGAIGTNENARKSEVQSLTFTARFADCERWDTDAAGWVGGTPSPGIHWASLGELSKVSGGIQKSPSNRPGLLAKPYLRVANVRRGRLDLAEVKTIEVTAEKLDKLRLEPGDLLFVEGNGSPDEIGRSAIWSGEIEDCVHQNHLIRARVDSPLLSPRFALAWFNCDIGRRHFKENARTTSGLLTLNLENIRSAPVPVLELEEQEKLAEELWSELETVDQVEAQISTDLLETRHRFDNEVFGI
ncbi:hypothetical protein [Arthrobacter bambusae]|uniref:Type I restriction enzyme S subunit n=1 Tax=Arthrobacter bambusae TaxID=1338426 RepID=A0AAW8DBY2_9MICC|nr:hypothetical protein [Arthrobacter bambusae]MDP9903122.1 type I restriction enzyme S subunit [Arthrobacter bambusae]MDQ0128884.1 type I restriction enzyme S subunit [Arthrobacter bambusae]MDQ0180225.1 type I restriction enzyme S subunit [Arthrobacter bambusae]